MIRGHGHEWRHDGFGGGDAHHHEHDRRWPDDHHPHPHGRHHQHEGWNPTTELEHWPHPHPHPHGRHHHDRWDLPSKSSSDSSSSDSSSSDSSSSDSDSNDEADQQDNLVLVDYFEDAFDDEADLQDNVVLVDYFEDAFDEWEKDDELSLLGIEEDYNVKSAPVLAEFEAVGTGGNEISDFVSKEEAVRAEEEEGE